MLEKFKTGMLGVLLLAICFAGMVAESSLSAMFAALGVAVCMVAGLALTERYA